MFSFSFKKNKLMFWRRGNSDVATLSRICSALTDFTATEFVRKVFIKNYSNFFEENYAKKIINETFFRLTQSQKPKASIEMLESTLELLSKKIYRNKDNHQFFKTYSEYKSSLKPAYYYSVVSQNIIGNKVLDFGSGKGYLSKKFLEHKFTITSTDILNYSEVDSKQIPFIKLSSIDNISSRIHEIDTTIALTVLHHIAENQLSTVLRSLSKVTKRLIIIEDIVNPEFFNNEQGSQSFPMNEFLKLSPESRLNAVIITDFYGNVVTQNLRSMNLPFSFKTMEAWIEILTQNGFTVSSSEEIGFPKISFHGFYQAKIICDSNQYSE